MISFISALLKPRLTSQRPSRTEIAFNYVRCKCIPIFIDSQIIIRLIHLEQRPPHKSSLTTWPYRVLQNKALRPAKDRIPLIRRCMFTNLITLHSLEVQFVTNPIDLKHNTSKIGTSLQITGHKTLCESNGRPKIRLIPFLNATHLSSIFRLHKLKSHIRSNWYNKLLQA